MGRVKFAVKEIRYKENMEIDTQQKTDINGLAANALYSAEEEELEEYEQVDSIIHNAPEDEGSHSD